MGLLDKLFRRNRADEDDEGTVVPIALDVEARRSQLLRFERACDALAAEMRADEARFDLPGWKERMHEYGRVAGSAMQLRQATPTREGLIDLAFEVRPVFSGAIPMGYEALGPLQDEVMAAARDLQEVLPGER